MIRLKAFVLFGLLGSALLVAEGGKFTVDIDRDGKEEKLLWSSIGSDQLGEYFAIDLFDDDGTLLWRGSRQKRITNPDLYSALHTGVSLPQLFFDIDSDGHYDLLAPEHQSDVSPTLFRRLSWIDFEFQKRPSRALMGSGSEGSRFSWTKPRNAFGTWVSGFGKVDGDLVEADVTSYEGEGSFSCGVALLRFDYKGADVVRWVKPLSSPAQNSEERSSRYQTKLNNSILLNLNLSIRYTRAALNKLKRSRERVKVWVVVDEYREQSVERENIASSETVVDPNKNVYIHYVPYTRNGFKPKDDRRYPVSIMITSARDNYRDNILDCSPVNPRERWDIDALKDSTLEYDCRLIGY